MVRTGGGRGCMIGCVLIRVCVIACKLMLEDFGGFITLESW